MSPSPVPTTKTDAMTFTEACQAVLSGRKLRHGLMDQGWAVLLHAGFLHVRKADGSLHILSVSEADITATDWTIVREH